MKCSASPAGCLLASLLLAGFLSPAHSSAIPMWEFLTRGEKMSHLFNMFVKQVADHCDHSNMPDCQKVLLVYGLTNLAKMEDDSLDKMDPYQRGANDIIWESMMHGSYKKKAPSTEHRDYYAEAIEPSTEEGNWIGSEEETAGSSRVESYTGDRHVLGPMVVRVRPDGSPVPQDQASPLPRDEDKEEYQMMRAKPVPSVEQLQKHGHRYSSIAEILASDEGEVKASTYKPSSHFSSIVELFATRRPYTVNTAKPSVGQDTAPGTFRPYFPPAEESITARPVNIGQGLGTSRPSQVLSRHVTSSVTVSRSPSQH